MIILRSNSQRRRIQRGKQEIWLTFPRQEPTSPVADAFGVLIAFDEMRLPSGEVSALDTFRETELVTYVYRGEITQENSTGNSGVVHTGEFQRMIIGRGVRFKEINPSPNHYAHIFRICLRPSEAGLDSAHEQMRFPAAERHNRLCVIASPDGRKKSLRILQDALIYSSILDPGHHIVHELLPGRSAWLHVIQGEAVLQNIILGKGDGVGVASEPSVSITAQESAEILLADLGPPERRFAGGAGQ
jgi:hypothetical protein